MKPYRHIPIEECGEPMQPIPEGLVSLTAPHPYEAFGAPYGIDQPWQLRAGIIHQLQRAQEALHHRHPGFRLKLFDAYRPNRIQAFMVQREFRLLSGGLPPESLSPNERDILWQKTLRIWAEPSDNPLTPPPHSTGAAMDLTLIHASGHEIDMGSPIDENSDRSSPDFFEANDPTVHANRSLLLEVMTQAGFTRHPEEWWHFSCGDQMWAYLTRQRTGSQTPVARYGRADLLLDEAPSEND